jgi:DNA-binding transcriptional ArsR family regulator
MFCIGNMRTFKFIRDPKAFEVIADETRRKMIYMLRAKDQTVSQLADALGKTPQAIYHQIKILLDSGLVEVAKEERVDHFIETYYRATAEVFEFSHGEVGGAEMEKRLKETTDVLSRLGLEVNTDDETLAKMAKIEVKMTKMGLPQELEEKISRQEDAGFITRQDAYRYAQLATMSDKQFEEMLANERELRKLLVSCLAKSAQRPSHASGAGERAK